MPHFEAPSVLEPVPSTNFEDILDEVDDNNDGKVFFFLYGSNII